MDGIGYDGKGADGKFSMEKWVDSKKAAGDWKGGESDKKFHKSFDSGKTVSAKTPTKPAYK